MKFVKMAWMLGGMSALGLGMAAQACSSSSNGSGGSSTGAGGTNCATLDACCPKLTGANNMNCIMLVSDANDSACEAYLGNIPAGTCTGTTTTGSSSSTTTTTTSSSSSVTTGGGSSGTGTSSTAGTSSSCATATLHSETAAGVYCPFSGVDGGSAITCAAGEHCCEPPEVTGQTTPPSTCEAAATACPTTGSTNWGCLGPLDCSGATPVCCGSGTLGTDPGCTTAYVSAFTGTTCVASCTTYKICEADSDCGAGSPAGTCLTTKAKGGQFGHCAN